MNRAISFYTKKLGLNLKSRDVVARFDLDGVLFELVPSPDETKLPGDGNARLCLKVEQIEKTLGELQSMGIQSSPIQVVEHGMLAAFADPDGNEIVLWQYR